MRLGALAGGWGWGVIDKKLADKLAKSPVLMGLVKNALSNNEPLWMVGINAPEQDVRDTIKAMEAR